MNNLYAIRKDLPKYKVLDLDILDITRNVPDEINLDSVYDFSQMNYAMAEWWKAPDTRYISTANAGAAAVPDISCWVDATLTLSPKAYRLLNDSLKDYGEFLPVSVAGESHYIFNCLTLGLPKEDKCTFNNEEGMQAGPKYLEFDQSASEFLVFKTPIENCLTLFCNERFKQIVESFGLRGAIFDDDLIVS